MALHRRDLLKMLGAMALISPSNILFSFQNNGNTGYYSIVKKAIEESWRSLPMNLLMEKIAFEFIDVPYVGGTLDSEENESCTVVLDKLDCVTYFETVMGIARCFKAKKYDYDDLVAEVQKTRYRNGVITNYTSRLHYTADWIYENVKNGTIKDITKEIGGEKIQFNTNFMSSNPDKYKSLKSNPEFVPIIKSQESNINSRTYYSIPKERLSHKINGVETSDIIAITTSIGGLDYAHTGFAYKNKEGDIQFLHASSSKKKALLDTYLSNYLLGIKKDVGITVLRVL
jgi:hypothetical protein